MSEESNLYRSVRLHSPVQRQCPRCHETITFTETLIGEDGKPEPIPAVIYHPSCWAEEERERHE